MPVFELHRCRKAGWMNTTRCFAVTTCRLRVLAEALGALRVPRKVAYNFARSEPSAQDAGGHQRSP